MGSTFAPKYKQLGFLNSARDRVRPSLLHFILLDTYVPAALVLVIVVGPLPITKTYK